MKKSIVNIFAILTTVLLLTSCWWTATDNSLKEHLWDGFKINVPNWWIEVEESTLPKIQNWKINLWMTSTELTAWFANNIVITSDDIFTDTTSLKYIITNYVRSSGELNSFTKLSETEFDFKDWDKWKIYTFEAKYNNETPKRKFLQTAKLCNKKAYLITIWLNLDKTTSEYENVLKTFECTSK